MQLLDSILSLAVAFHFRTQDLRLNYTFSSGKLTHVGDMNGNDDYTFRTTEGWEYVTCYPSNNFSFTEVAPPEQRTATIGEELTIDFNGDVDSIREMANTLVPGQMYNERIQGGKNAGASGSVIFDRVLYEWGSVILEFQNGYQLSSTVGGKLILKAVNG